MDAQQKDIIKKIKKILRLAEKAGSEEEARTAMQMAREMLAKYNLSMGDVNSISEEQCNQEFFTFKGRYFPGHVKLLVDAMSLLFQCRCVFIRDKKLREITVNFIGVDADPIVACQTYQFLMQFAKRKAKERKVRSSEKNDYYFGFAHSILERAIEIHESAMATPRENALVPVKDAAINKYLASHYDTTKTSRAPRRRYGSQGLFAGLSDGKKASLDREVENSSKLALQ